MRLVRQSVLVALGGALAALLPAAARGQAAWEYSPYQIQVWIAAEAQPQLPPQVQSELALKLVSRAETVCPAVWNLAVEPAPATIRGALPAGLNLPAERLKALAPDVLKSDKLIVVRLSPGSLGWEVVAREFDCRAWQWGPVAERSASCAAELPLAIWDAVVEAFVPLARIESVEGTGVVARLRAGGLVVRANSPALIDKGRILQPIVRRNDRSGQPIAKTGIQSLAWTLMGVESRAD